MMVNTSLISYMEEKSSGKAARLRSQVLLVLKNNSGISDRDIAQILKRDLRSVGARRNELMNLKKPKVTCMGTKICEFTGKKVKVWGVWNGNI